MTDINLEGNIYLSEPQGSSLQYNDPFGSDTHKKIGYSQSSFQQQIVQQPPLLEDLGIDIVAIKKKVIGVLKMEKIDTDLLINHPDIAGPIAIVIFFAVLLLFQGKVHFGHIYGSLFCGCILIYSLLNLMIQESIIEFFQTISILGYGMLPLTVFSLPAIFFDLRNNIGILLGVICILWCTNSAVKLFDSITSFNHKKWLIAYPIGIFYACFFILIIF